jgi:protein involved in polysaccharide export with SLBB domain
MRRFHIHLLSVAALLLALSPALSSAQGTTTDILSRPEFASPIDPDIYLVRPGDRLTVRFLETDLKSLDLIVSAEGFIVDEQVGEIDARLRPLAAVRADLISALGRQYEVAQIKISVNAPLSISVMVTGAVRKPGTYQAMTSQHVSELIQLAGGISDFGSRRNIQLVRPNGFLRADLDRALYLGDAESDPSLYAGTAIHVPVRESDPVQVAGAVRRPLEIELTESDDLTTLLSIAGGMNAEADPDGVIVFRKDTKVDRSSKLVAGDAIWVPTREIASKDALVAVFGEVTHPGLYRLSRTSNLTTLIEAAGGFTPESAPTLTTIFRSIRSGKYIGQRFPIAHLVASSDQLIDINLVADDSIFVPAAVGYIRITGEIVSPGLQPYELNKPASYYIERAGGYLLGAERERISLYNRVAGTRSIVAPGTTLHDGDEISVMKREEN